MLRTLVLAALVSGLGVSSAFADVTYTIKVDVKKGKAPASSSPVFARVGQALVQALAPGGASTMTLSANESAVRVESDSPGLNLPKGGALLRNADGSRAILDPTQREYWTLPALRTGQSRPASPKLTFMRTGKFSKIAGVRAERVEFSAAFEVPQGGRATQAEPISFTVEGELWVANGVKVPDVARQMTNTGLQAMGLDNIVQDGFVVRQVLRSALFNGLEIESLVTRLSSKPVAADRLEVPKEYTEVKPRQTTPTAPAQNGRGSR